MVLAETVFITLSGGILGTVAAVVGSSIIESFVKGMLPYSPGGSLISYSPELVGFALGFSVLLGLVCGIYPALNPQGSRPWRQSEVALNERHN